MGVNDLCSYLYSDQTRNNSLETLEGFTLGVDISGWLHKLIQIKSDNFRFARSFFQIPPISLEDFVNNWLSNAFRIFDKHNIKLIFVFDGMRHSLKAREDNSRADNIYNNRNKFEVLLSQNNQNDLPNIRSEEHTS
jgi:hypothetical protein